MTIALVFSKIQANNNLVLMIKLENTKAVISLNITQNQISLIKLTNFINVYTLTDKAVFTI